MRFNDKPGRRGTTAPDYYEVLQVSPNADEEIIQAAYRRLAEKWHPDKNPGDPFAHERMRLLNEAYEVLSDPRKRCEYDSWKCPSDRSSAGVSGGLEPAEPNSLMDDGAKSPHTKSPVSDHGRGDASRWRGIPDASIIFIAGTILFLIGRFAFLTGEPPAGLLAFLITCFVWGILFATPAYFCSLNKLRTGTTVVATLFLFAAGLDVAVAVYVNHESEAITREPRLRPQLPESPVPKPGLSAYERQLAHELAMLKMPPDQAVPRLLKASISTVRPWEEVAEDLRNDGVNPEQFREQYQLELAQRQQEINGESLLVHLARRAIPVVSAVRDLNRVGRYGASVRRFNSGKASKEDIDLIARFERQHGLNQREKSTDATATRGAKR